MKPFHLTSLDMHANDCEDGSESAKPNQEFIVTQIHDSLRDFRLHLQRHKNEIQAANDLNIERLNDILDTENVAVAEEDEVPCKCNARRQAIRCYDIES
jgi:hypothetical protein